MFLVTTTDSRGLHACQRVETAAEALAFAESMATAFPDVRVTIQVVGPALSLAAFRQEHSH